MKIIVLGLMVIAVTACSGSKSASDSEDTGIELADAVEFNDTESTDVIAENTDPMMSEDMMEPASESMMEPTNMEMSEPMANLGTEQRSYTVKKNETLMMIAFQVYGDYRRWKSIADMNQDVLNGSQTISEGMQLRYMAPAQEFTFSPSGNPYLIKQGDTLGTISTDTYGTTKHWKDIWNNNKPLIRDPNRIFAGFTIFTPTLEGRDVAFDDL